MKDIVVTVAAPEVALTDGRGTITVTVVNREPRPERVVLTALGGTTSPTAVPPVTTVDRPLRDVGPGQTEQFVASIDATAATAGLHTVRFVAAPSEEAAEEYADRAASTSVVVAERVVVVKPPRRFPWWVVAVAALVVVVVVTFVVVRSHSGSTPPPTPPSTTTSTTTGTAQGTPVPTVIGLSQQDATARLSAAGFTHVTITRDHRPSGLGSGTVVSVSPATGVLAATDTTVTLTVATPSLLVPVPDVVGQTYSDAASLLQSLGLVARPGGQCVSSQTFCRVVSEVPDAGTQVPRGQSVQLVGQLTKFG